MSKQYLTLNVDFETMGFNKPYTLPDGTVVHGAAYHGILEGAFQLLDEDNNIIDQVEGYVLDMDRKDNWNESTYEFHKETYEEGVEPFLPKWERAIEESRVLTLQELEGKVIKMLLDNLGVLDEAHPKNEIQINLSARSVHFDASYIDVQMPNLSFFLSHQLMDVTTFRLALRKYHPTLWDIIPGVTNHNAMDDCNHILKELEVIRRFIQQVDFDGRYLSDYVDEMDQDTTWGDIGRAIVAKLMSVFK